MLTLRSKQRGRPVKVTPSFLQVYNTTFRWILEREGYDALKEYWKAIAPVVASDLIELAKENGVQGCAQYWRKVLAEEGVSFILDLHNNNKLTLTITDCASLRHIEKPCKHYCNHCGVIYKEVLEPLGLKYEWHKTGEQSCQIRVTELCASGEEVKPRP